MNIGIASKLFKLTRQKEYGIGNITAWSLLTKAEQIPKSNAFTTELNGSPVRDHELETMIRVVFKLISKVQLIKQEDMYE